MEGWGEGRTNSEGKVLKRMKWFSLSLSLTCYPPSPCTPLPSPPPEKDFPSRPTQIPRTPPSVQYKGHWGRRDHLEQPSLCPPWHLCRGSSSFRKDQQVKQQRQLPQGKVPPPPGVRVTNPEHSHRETKGAESGQQGKVCCLGWR